MNIGSPRCGRTSAPDCRQRRFEGSVVVEKVREGKDGFGFNAATGEYEDLLAAGIIDPKQVSRFALQHASSVAALLLTTECAIAELPSLSLRLLLRPAWAAAWAACTKKRSDGLLPVAPDRKGEPRRRAPLFRIRDFSPCCGRTFCCRTAERPRKAETSAPGFSEPSRRRSGRNGPAKAFGTGYGSTVFSENRGAAGIFRRMTGPVPARGERGRVFADSPCSCREVLAGWKAGARVSGSAARELSAIDKGAMSQRRPDAACAGAIRAFITGQGVKADAAARGLPSAGNGHTFK